MKLGKAFADNVSFVTGSSGRMSREGGNAWWLGSGRALLFVSVFFIAFAVLVWRLFTLTVIHGHTYRALANTNKTRELVRHAPRGILTDRTGKPLVANIPQYRLIKPCEGTDVMVSCVTRLTKDEGESLAQHGLPLGWYLEVDYLRQYLYPEAFAHIVGYVGELTEEEMQDEYYQLRNYRRGDRIGRTGAEAVFEDRLRGRDGKELVEVDANGKILRVLGKDDEVTGETILLPLDIGIGMAAYRAFPQGQKGAIIVTKPLTGEILTLYSSPSYQPNKFSLGMSDTEYAGLLEDADRPLFNRAVGGTYPPGSTFKIVTALAGLEEKAVTKDTVVNDIGVITIGPFTFPNWYFTQYGRTEGLVSIVRAIARSNDIFFYKVGEWLGIDKLAKWAHIAGVGSSLGIEIGGEASGLMPGPKWKDQTFHTAQDLLARNNQWYLGDTYHVAIGQGYLLTTPLQVNAWTNIIANSGYLCRPTITKSVLPGYAQKNCKNIGIQKETIQIITEGMRLACAPGGTGWPLFGFTVTKKTLPQTGETEWALSPTPVQARKTHIPVACKTGTAEFGDPNDKTHAWFTAFAPIASDYIQDEENSEQDTESGEPEISVTVLVEGAGEGSNVAAPIAKSILEEWFSR